MVKHPSDWSYERIDTKFSVTAGGDVNRAAFSRVGSEKYPYPVYSNGLENNGIYGYTSAPLYPKNSLTVTARGTIGSVFYRDTPFDAVIRLLVLSPLDNSTNPKYFKYYINHIVEFERENTGVPQLTIPKISEKRVAFPLKEEQDRIVIALETFDIHIANLTELIEKKKAIREGALEDLISGKTRLSGFTGRWETVNFESVIIPKARIGWQGLKSDEYLRQGFCYLIGGTDFYNGTVSLDNIWFVSEERYAMDANIQVEENDVLVTKDGTIGKIALVPHLEKPAALNSGVFVFRTQNGLSRQFLYRVLISSVFKEFIDTLAAGSTIKHLYQKDLKNFKFPIPLDEAEQEAIATTLTTMDDEIHSLEEERDKMIKIREGAMDDLLTGKVRLT